MAEVQTEELTVAPSVELRMMTCWTKIRIQADTPEEAVMMLVDTVNRIRARRSELDPSAGSSSQV